jgi:DNA-binding beta-propeller fold protein YncE/mono/diheme cytochrome c family protein
MGKKRALIGTTVASLMALGLSLAHSEADMMFPGDFGGRGGGVFVARFQMMTPPIALKDSVKRNKRASLAGSSISALGSGALFVDADSGDLVRVGRDGKQIAKLHIGVGASQLVVDRARKRAYVVDRAGDKVVVVSTARTLKKLDSHSTGAEPFGIALTPDGTTLLVTTVANGELAALDAADGTEHWRIDIGPEPRGVAISPKGNEAMVTSLISGTVAKVSLSGKKEPKVSFAPLQQGQKMNANIGMGPAFNAKGRPASIETSANPQSAPGNSFARNAFSALYVSANMAIVPHQVSTPHQAEGSERVGTYGGGFNPPIVHHLAMVSTKGRTKMAFAQIGTHQPRAIAYDAKGDRLFVAGHGSDELLVIGDATSASLHLSAETPLGVPPEFNSKDPALNKSGKACGPTGIAVADNGDALVFCSLTRSIVTVSESKPGALAVKRTDSLTKSRLSDDQLAGRTIFRKGNDFRLSGNGALACASCHPEGRTDGLSWRIEGKVLQTPLLAGRISGTHPFKWDAADKNITASLTNTVRRLGGSGVTAVQVKQLNAFLDSLPAPRAPTPDSMKAVARGKKVFSSKTVGCATCHNGKKMTNGKQYDLAADLDKVDTPSLIGLAHSAPYYHDGSAATLEALLLENGSVHGMGDVKKLSDRQIDDLIAYLESL